MPGLLPPDQSSQIAQLRKRVEQLERATRVPQITTATRGAAAVNLLTSQSYIPPGETYTNITGGPALPVNVRNTGRLLVFLFVDLTMEGDFPSSTYTSYRLDGPAAIAASDTWAIPRFSNGAGVGRTGVYLHENLEPGAYTLTLQARHPGLAPSVSTYQRRQLVALPL